jgi:NAD(P)-dependent dehydrogenase (short-subunit alcohol dehydrogenase family)
VVQLRLDPVTARPWWIGLAGPVRGRIVFTAAPLSSLAIPAPYLAGKAGFIGLARHIDRRYRRHGRRVTAFTGASQTLDAVLAPTSTQARS